MNWTELKFANSTANSPIGIHTLITEWPSSAAVSDACDQLTLLVYLCRLVPVSWVQFSSSAVNRTLQVIALGAARSTSVRGRVRSPHMAKLQAVSVPIAYGSWSPMAAAPRDRQTGGSRYRLMPPYGGGDKKPISLQSRARTHWVTYVLRRQVGRHMSPWQRYQWAMIVGVAAAETAETWTIATTASSSSSSAAAAAKHHHCPPVVPQASFTSR